PAAAEWAAWAIWAFKVQKAQTSPGLERKGGSSEPPFSLLGLAVNTGRFSGALREEQQLDGEGDGNDDHQRTDDASTKADAGDGAQIAAENLAHCHHGCHHPHHLARKDEKDQRGKVGNKIENLGIGRSAGG